MEEKGWLCVALSRDSQQRLLVTDSVNAAIKIFDQDRTVIAQYNESGLLDFLLFDDRNKVLI